MKIEMLVVCLEPELKNKSENMLKDFVLPRPMQLGCFLKDRI